MGRGDPAGGGSILCAVATFQAQVVDCAKVIGGEPKFRQLEPDPALAAGRGLDSARNLRRASYRPACYFAIASHRVIAAARASGASQAT